MSLATTVTSEPRRSVIVIQDLGIAGQRQTASSMTCQDGLIPHQLGP